MCQKTRRTFVLLRSLKWKRKILKSNYQTSASQYKDFWSWFDLSSIKARSQYIEDLASRELFWNNSEQAKTLLREKTELDNKIKIFETLQNKLLDSEEYFALLSDENDLICFVASISEIEKEVKKLELDLLFSGENDSRNCILSINAGQGGAESCDFTSMLYRMYSRFCEQQN